MRVSALSAAVLIIVFFGPSQLMAIEFPLSAHDAASQMAGSLAWTDNSVVQAEVEVTTVESHDSGKVISNRLEYQLTRYVASDGRIRLSRSSLDDKWRSEDIVTGGEAINWSGRLVAYTRSSKNLKRLLQEARYNVMGGWFLEGNVGVAADSVVSISHLDAHWRVGELLKEDNVDGVKAVVVTASSDIGELTLWLDPAHGYLPLKYALSNSEQHRAKHGSVEIMVDGLQTKSIEGKHIIISGQYSEVYVPPPPQRGKSITTAKVTRTRVDLHPDFTASRAFDLNCVPDGTKVAIQVDPTETEDNLRYVWKAGKPVLDYDPALVNRIRQQVKDSKEASP